MAASPSTSWFEVNYLAEFVKLAMQFGRFLEARWRNAARGNVVEQRVAVERLAFVREEVLEQVQFAT